MFTDTHAFFFMKKFVTSSCGLHSTVYLVFWPSDLVVDCIRIGYIFRPLTTGTMPLTNQILHTAIKWRATLHKQ